MALQVSLNSERHESCGWFRQEIGPRSDIPVLLIQGFPGGGDDVLGVGHRLAGYGISTLTYCHRGVAPSGGTACISHETANIDVAVAFIRDPVNATRYGYDPAKLVIGGWSYGGGNAVAYVAHHPEIRRVFSVSGTDHGELARRMTAYPEFASMFREMFRQMAASGV